MQGATIKDFTNLSELARGPAGIVYRAIHKPTSKHVVLKERRRAEGCKFGDIMREVKLLSQLDHPNIIKCFGFFWHQNHALYIVLEWAEHGDLSQIVERAKRQNNPLKEDRVWKLFMPLCNACVYLHAQGIVHRDLKTMNVFITASDTIKLGDFGVGRQLSENTQLLETVYGTPLYLSPELCANESYNEKTDVWSLGVILFELAALKHPFSGRNIVVSLESGERERDVEGSG